jgi:hypothetical protein
MATVGAIRTCSRTVNVTTYILLFASVSLQPGSGAGAITCNTTLLGVPKDHPE